MLPTGQGSRGRDRCLGSWEGRWLSWVEVAGERCPGGAWRRSGLSPDPGSIWRPPNGTAICDSRRGIRVPLGQKTKAPPKRGKDSSWKGNQDEDIATDNQIAAVLRLDLKVKVRTANGAAKR